MITNPNTSGTITTTVDHNINYVTIMNQDQDIKTPDNFTQEPQVLGWSRDSDGKVINRHPVNVANTLTAQKGNTMQNYVVEQEVLNASADGTATTLTTAHHYSGNIIDPKRGQKEMGVLEILNPDKDGNARTIGTHYADMNAESVTRKSGDGDGYVRTAVKETTQVGFRIRKLTPRTCFRLMGVSDEDIDKIQAASISKSRQYALAGNSIVVDVLEAIFRKMFIDTSNEDAQLTLF